MSKELRDKFSHIGFLDYKKVIKDLDKIDSIREKLNYLKDIKVKYFDQFEEVFKSLNKDEEQLYIQNRTEIWNSIFDEAKTVTTLKIQEPVFNKYFENSLNDPEFTYWFLEYNAGEMLEEFKKSKEYDDKFNSNLKEELFQADLNEIMEEEKNAKKLLIEKKINLFDNYQKGKGLLWTFNENNYLIEVLRVLDGNYYKKKATHNLSDWSSNDAKAYYRHIVLKPFLEELVEEIENPKTENKKPIKLVDIIDKKNNLMGGDISIKEVYDFFKVLVDKPTKKGKFFLTEEQLIIFIKTTFIDETPSKQYFNIPFNKDKINVRSVFRRFQDYCYDLEYNKIHVKNKYFDIMTKSFFGFNDIDYQKWAKTNNKIPTIKKIKSK